MADPILITTTTGSFGEIPDFSLQTPSHLKFLLQQYKDSLDAIELLYSKQHPEYNLYKSWVDAIELELLKRPPPLKRQ